jgi:hypothetical protein
LNLDLLPRMTVQEEEKGKGNTAKKGKMGAKGKPFK